MTVAEIEEPQERQPGLLARQCSRFRQHHGNHVGRGHDRLGQWSSGHRTPRGYAQRPTYVGKPERRVAGTAPRIVRMTECRVARRTFTSGRSQNRT